MVKAFKLPKAEYIEALIAPPLPTATPFVEGKGFHIIGASDGLGGITTPPPTGKKASNTNIGCGWQTLQKSVFLSPKRVDLGVSADATVRTFEMWHTFEVPLVITQIAQTGTRGMTLTREGGNIEDLIPALGFAKYTLNIGLQTDTVIDAEYKWITSPSVEGVSIHITGSRIVPWPYIPEGSFTETREWLTDVIRTRKKEQRLSLRRGPRKTVSHSYMLGDSDLSNMWSHDKVWVNQTYAVPDWTKFMRLGPVTKGTLELNIKAVDLGLRASGFAFIYENNAKYEVRPVKAVEPNKVVFVDSISRDYDDATIVVIELQKHQQPLSIVRTAMGVSVAQATWEKLDDTLNASNPFPQYAGRPVVTDHILMGGTRASERFGYDLDRIDSQLGIYTDFQEYDWETQTRGQLKWSCNDRAEFDRVRNFLDYCRGKQGEFFVPTWNNDFELALNITSGQGVKIKPNAATLFFKPFHIMIQYVDGSRDFVKVTSAVREMDFDTLQTQPVVASRPMEQVSRICRLNLMRFDTDRFEFQHRDSGEIDISAPIVAVPEN